MICFQKGIDSPQTSEKFLTSGLSAVAETERETLLLLAIRLLIAVGDTHRYAETVITTKCGGFGFTAKGKTYDCVAALDDTGGQYVNFTMKFAAKKNN